MAFRNTGKGCQRPHGIGILFRFAVVTAEQETGFRHRQQFGRVRAAHAVVHQYGGSAGPDDSKKRNQPVRRIVTPQRYPGTFSDAHFPELSVKAHDALPHVLIGAAAAVADNGQAARIIIAEVRGKQVSVVIVIHRLSFHISGLNQIQEHAQGQNQSDQFLHLDWISSH